MSWFLEVRRKSLEQLHLYTMDLKLNEFKTGHRKTGRMATIGGTSFI